jgi:hypothetical protein
MCSNACTFAGFLPCLLLATILLGSLGMPLSIWSSNNFHSQPTTLNHRFGGTNYLMLQFFFGAPAAAPLPAPGATLAQEIQDEHQVTSSLAPTVTRYDEGNHLSPIHAARATSPAPVHVPRVTAQAPPHTHAPHATGPAPRIRGHHHHLHPGWVFTFFLNFFCLSSRLHSVANMVMNSCLWSIIEWQLLLQFLYPIHSHYLQYQWVFLHLQITHKVQFLDTQ